MRIGEQTETVKLWNIRVLKIIYLTRTRDKSGILMRKKISEILKFFFSLHNHSSEFAAVYLNKTNNMCHVRNVREPRFFRKT